MHDVRHCVETDADGMLGMRNEVRGDVTRDASRSVRSVVVRVEDGRLGRSALVVEERDRLRRIPSKTGARGARCPPVPIEVSGEKGRLARLRRPPDSKRVFLAAGGVELVQDAATYHDSVD